VVNLLRLRLATRQQQRHKCYRPDHRAFHLYYSNFDTIALWQTAQAQAAYKLGLMPSVAHSLAFGGPFAYIAAMLWRVRNSRGRPKNAPAAFIQPCRRGNETLGIRIR
jgi:hypothetical protein